MSYDHETIERRWIASALQVDPDTITFDYYPAWPWVTIHVGNGHYGGETIDAAIAVAAESRGIVELDPEPDPIARATSRPTLDGARTALAIRRRYRTGDTADMIETETCAVCDGPFTPTEWENRHTTGMLGGADIHARCCAICKEN